METEINYFSGCTDQELKIIWDNRDKFCNFADDNPIRPYLEKYYSTQSQRPALLCELDFYKECAKRFMQSISIESKTSAEFDKNETFAVKPYGINFMLECCQGTYQGLGSNYTPISCL